MEQRSNELSNALDVVATGAAIRVVIILRKGSEHHTKPPSEVINIVLSALCLSAKEYFLLVQEKWDRCDALVFDLFNADYSWENGHAKFDLPVICVDFSRTNRRISIASPMLQEEVNTGVASHHNLNGWEAHPPYFADHTLDHPPCYEDPRNVSHA